MKGFDVVAVCWAIGFCEHAIVSAIIVVTDNNLTGRRAANFIRVQTCYAVVYSLYGSAHCEIFVKLTGSYVMSFQKGFQLVAVGILAAVIVAGIARGADGSATQDVSGLDRRISMLEQRFYSLETSMNRLQQVVTSQRSTGSTSSDLRDRELDQMRQEVQRLQLRLNEVECNLLKLDERTATAGGNRRSGEARPVDPCRQNPGSPVRLPARP